MTDNFGRIIDYMRISVTDRCNLRCKYCMPRDIEAVSMQEILTFEEIRAVVRAAVELGITNFRITGGEPLIRKGCVFLVHMLSSITGVERISMTSNGILLRNYAWDLKQAGLDSINVSLDTTDSVEFAELTGNREELQCVLEGIEAAKAAGLSVKINTVARECVPWQSVVEYADSEGVVVRFIEMMPIGYGKQYTSLSNEWIRNEMEKHYGRAREVSKSPGNGPAVYYAFEGLSQPVGFISALHRKFCSSCNRVRLTAQGFLKLCLCYDEGIDLRQVLRNDGEAGISELMKEAIMQKPREHCFEDKEAVTEKHTMVVIGG